jgi:hypothetical protein
MCCGSNKVEVQLLKCILERFGRGGIGSRQFQVQSEVVRGDFAAKLKSEKVPGVALRFRIGGPIERGKKRNWGRLLTGQIRTKTRRNVGHLENRVLEETTLSKSAKAADKGI